MCLTLLKQLFNILPPDKLPHPEEPPNHTQTIYNVNVDDAITLWLVDYGVPNENWGYWGSRIDIQVYETYPDYMLAWGVPPDVPAFSWEESGLRHIAIKPEWLNSGVIAHEQAHNSIDLLDEDEILEFETTYVSLYLAGNKMLHLMDDYTNYINYPIDDESELLETHAECYRFLGLSMPEELYQFYPYLIDSG